MRHANDNHVIVTEARDGRIVVERGPLPAPPASEWRGTGPARGEFEDAARAFVVVPPRPVGGRRAA